MENEIVVKKTSGWVKFLKIALAIAAIATVVVLVYKKFFKKKAVEELAEADVIASHPDEIFCATVSK